MNQISADKNFLVVGSGGIGGYFGGRLAEHGHDVTFLARGDHYRSILSDGLRVKSVIGDFLIHPAKVIPDLAINEKYDIVLFCVKTYDTVSVAGQLSPVLKDDSIIISIQNGIDNEILISQHIGKGKVYPGLAHIISTKITPGEIAQTAGPRELVFGDVQNPQNQDLINLAEVMKKAKIDARASKDIEKDLWFKFILIASFSGLTSAYRTAIGGIIENTKRFALYKNSVKESISVAKAYGVKLDDDTYERIISRLETYRGAQAGSKSSMLKDIEAGRQTEVDSLSGAVVRMGLEIGVPTPIHQAIRDAVLSGELLGV